MGLVSDVVVAKTERLKSQDEPTEGAGVTASEVARKAGPHIKLAN